MFLSPMAAMAAFYAGTQIAPSLSGNAIPSSAFYGAITLSSFAAAIVHGSIRAVFAAADELSAPRVSD
jgi:hypothetical protein